MFVVLYSYSKSRTFVCRFVGTSCALFLRPMLVDLCLTWDFCSYRAPRIICLCVMFKLISRYSYHMFVVCGFVFISGSNHYVCGFVLISRDSYHMFNDLCSYHETRTICLA